MSILLRIRHREEAKHHAELMAEIARDVPVGTPIKVTSSTPAGDSQRLRGIPIYARGVGGAINGTRPGAVR